MQLVYSYLYQQVTCRLQSRRYRYNVWIAYVFRQLEVIGCTSIGKMYVSELTHVLSHEQHVIRVAVTEECKC